MPAQRPIGRGIMSHAEGPEYISADDYLRNERGSLHKSEYVDGWVRAMTGGTLRHNAIVGNCFVAIANRLRGNRCKPFNSDTKLRILHEGAKRFYYPDLQVVCESNDPTSDYQERPVLIIEVLSPATRRYDLDEKMTAYLAIPSLECYIALEQHQPSAIVMRRTERGFLRESVEGSDERIELPTIASSLPMRELYDGVDFTPECVQEADEAYSS